MSKVPITHAMTNDEVLITRFQNGEGEAFDRLMSLHANRVFALAWGILHNREDAVDAVQEVFIKLHRALPGLSPDDNLSAWLYRVCLNHCIDRKRRHKHAVSELTDEDWERLQGPDINQPEEVTIRREQSRMIQQAVDHLPKKQRTVFILRHYKLLSIAEIADAMCCSIGAVKAHQSRATANLRNTLKQSFFPRTAEVDKK